MVASPKQVLDFLVIGAQKAGTTSLFEYLRTHPGIAMPAAKEVPFFSDESTFAAYDERVARLVAGVFARAPAGALWGKATPSYMYGSLVPEGLDARRQGELLGMPATEGIVPERIRVQLPDVRLVAVLRDPVERAASGHRMQTLHGLERRTFEDAIEQALRPEALERARRLPGRTDNYVVLGEYGRILRAYYERFPADRIHVLFTDELEAAPQPTVAELFAFLGADPAFVPPNLDTRYLVGSTSRRVAWLDADVRARLKGYPGVRRAWRTLPADFRNRAADVYSTTRLRLTMWNRVPDAPDADPVPPDVRARLRAHFAADTEGLGELIGRRPPWAPDDAAEAAVG